MWTDDLALIPNANPRPLLPGHPKRMKIRPVSVPLPAQAPSVPPSALPRRPAKFPPAAVQPSADTPPLSSVELPLSRDWHTGAACRMPPRQGPPARAPNRQTLYHQWHPTPQIARWACQTTQTPSAAKLANSSICYRKCCHWERSRGSGRARFGSASLVLLPTPKSVRWPPPGAAAYACVSSPVNTALCDSAGPPPHFARPPSPCWPGRNWDAAELPCVVARAAAHLKVPPISDK